MFSGYTSAAQIPANLLIPIYKITTSDRLTGEHPLKERTPIADTLAEVFMTEDDWDEDFVPGAEGRSPQPAAGAETGRNPIGLTAYQSMVAG